ENNIGSDGVVGIDLWSGPGYPAFGNVFRYNIMHNIDTYGIYMGGSQDNHGITNGPIRGYNYNNLIHHNIVYNNGFGPGQELKGSGLRQNNTPREEDGPNYWYNNIMYANRFNFSGSTSFAGRFVFINNLSLDPVEKHLELDGSNTISNDLNSSILSHNLYYPDGSAGMPLFNWHGDYATFSDYQQASGQDLDGSFVADPMLANPSIDPQISDFSLTANSPAINSGADVVLLQDINGNPVDGAPDIGAYEYPDSDNDGIFTIDEIALDLNPLHPDTDWDGINDGNDIDPANILSPNSEGWNLSITNDYSDPDSPEGIYPQGITLNILIWTDQLDLNTIRTTQYQLKLNKPNSVVVAEVNQATCSQATYTCNTSMNLSDIPSGGYWLNIKIQDDHGPKFYVEIPITIQ
ncbi:MAG: hypothetical protein OEZ15_03130, partial [Gammaproteobacteria bacterium]|nr:hypothetical protein [Gammaproteobacteria bacterium]